jgi:hypothetical protein
MSPMTPPPRLISTEFLSKLFIESFSQIVLQVEIFFFSSPEGTSIIIELFILGRRLRHSLFVF